MASKKYDDLTKEDLIRLLHARDRRDATRFGLVWEANEIERDNALNSDFVALDLDEKLSCGPKHGPWKNLIIEGDNFDALRYLRMTFAGRVKCIYIDPPYNTGNKDFVYNDHYVDKEDLWRHSKWCEFMYQRLVLAKDLLTQDGALVVSIDDNEIFALGMLMKRVFGERSFVANCVWQKRYSRENRGAIGDAHEYVLFFSPNPPAFQLRRGLIPLGEKQRSVYKNPNDDPEGPWQSVSMTAQGYRPNQMYSIVAPSGKVHVPPEGRCWSIVEAEYNKLLAQGSSIGINKRGRIWFGADGNGVPRRIYYLHEAEGLVPWTWWNHEEVGHTDEAKREIRQWFGTQTAFETPKPVRLLERILQIAAGPDDVVLDFFAGSGTTAHAVLKLNRSTDGREQGGRRFILVSSTEATEGESEKNLCRDVCATRVRRVIEGYGEGEDRIEGLGGDFAYLRCRRIPIGELTEIDHAQVWTALQLTHCPTVASFDDKVPFVTAETEEEGGTLVYVPLLKAANSRSLVKTINEARSAVLYTWQPDLAKMRLKNAANVQIEAVPQSLARRFGVRGGI